MKLYNKGEIWVQLNHTGCVIELNEAFKNTYRFSIIGKKPYSPQFWEGYIRDWQTDKKITDLIPINNISEIPKKIRQKIPTAPFSKRGSILSLIIIVKISFFVAFFY